VLAPTLETARLILRPPGLRDWEAYARTWADPRVTQFIGAQPRSRQESWTKFAQSAGLWALVGYGFWSFIDRETQSFVGTGGLARFERGLAELEGYPEAGWVLAPEAWGRGLATEAMQAVLSWADAALRGDEVRCIIDPGNPASRRVAEKLGFQECAEVQFPPDLTLVYRRLRPKP